MNKKGLVDYVASGTGMTKKDSKVAVDAVLEGIKSGLVTEGKVNLTNFGSFVSSLRKARKGRNPQTGDELDIPEKLVPKFKASKDMKEQVESDGVEPGSGNDEE